MKNSRYKTTEDLLWMEDWAGRVMAGSTLRFEKQMIPTGSGNTCVYSYQHHRTELPTLVILPGMRTSGLFWLINNTLAVFREKYRIFIVDNIGQPGFSEGTNLPVKTNRYGYWLNELTNGLNLTKAYWMGASFGCQLIVKLSQVAPEKIEKACFVCPGGIVQIGMTWKNLSANMFIMWFKSNRSKNRFLDKVVYGPGFRLKNTQHTLLAEAVFETVKRFDMKTGYPYPMPAREFVNMKMPLLMLPGQNDPMFSPERLLPQIRKVFPVQPGFDPLPGHGHGGELSPLSAEKAFAFFNEK